MPDAPVKLEPQARMVASEVVSHVTLPSAPFVGLIHRLVLSPLQPGAPLTHWVEYWPVRLCMRVVAMSSGSGSPLPGAVATCVPSTKRWISEVLLLPVLRISTVCAWPSATLGHVPVYVKPAVVYGKRDILMQPRSTVCEFHEGEPAPLAP